MRRTIDLVLSDYLIRYSYKEETPARRWLLFLPRLLSNPSLHATLLLRLTYATPVWMHWIWRNILLTKHTIDIEKQIEIGPGLDLPHPWGLCWGAGAKIGSNCVIHHNVSIGSRARHQRTPEGRECPVIGAGVVIYSGALIFGPITIGDGAIIGAYAWVDRDVPAGAVVAGGRR